MHPVRIRVRCGLHAVESSTRCLLTIRRVRGRERRRCMSANTSERSPHDPVRVYVEAPLPAARWCEDGPVRIVPCSEPPPADGFYLRHDAQGLALWASDFEHPFRLKNRDVAPGGLVLQACAGRARAALSILDAFAGYGTDGYALARRHAVTMIEREPMVCVMQREFGERLGMDTTGYCADALALMQTTGQKWDVVYLDPMFPARSKKALPARGMQHLQSLSAEAQEVDLADCLALAQARANLRVVIKRRLRDPVLAKPALQLRGKSVRFDVYT